MDKPNKKFLELNAEEKAARIDQWKRGQYKAINWNNIEDDIDKQTWEKLTSQFWLDTRIPVSNDLDDWRMLSTEERRVVDLAFGGLTLLDTLQSQDALNILRRDHRSPQEIGVYNNIEFMETVHAKSYSTIFITLNSTSRINEIFDWTDTYENLQYKANRINDIYQNGSALQAKAANVMLETFLFYSGFFAPLWYLGNNKLENVAEIIKLIIRDESVHGTYIGYKFQKGYLALSDKEREQMKQ